MHWYQLKSRPPPAVHYREDRLVSPRRLGLSLHVFLHRRGGSGGGGLSPSSIVAIRNQSISNERMQRDAYVCEIGDGRARNCLVVKCKHFGTIDNIEKKQRGEGGGGGGGGVAVSKAFMVKAGIETN